MADEAGREVAAAAALEAREAPDEATDEAEPTTPVAPDEAAEEVMVDSLEEADEEDCLKG